MSHWKAANGHGLPLENSWLMTFQIPKWQFSDWLLMNVQIAISRKVNKLSRWNFGDGVQLILVFHLIFLYQKLWIKFSNYHQRKFWFVSEDTQEVKLRSFFPWRWPRIMQVCWRSLFFKVLCEFRYIRTEEHSEQRICWFLVRDFKLCDVLSSIFIFLLCDRF